MEGEVVGSTHQGPVADIAVLEFGAVRIFLAVASN